MGRAARAAMILAASGGVVAALCLARAIAGVPTQAAAITLFGLAVLAAFAAAFAAGRACAVPAFRRDLDLARRDASERAIGEERDQLAAFLDDVPVGFYSVDGDGRFVAINRTLARWLGGTPPEIVAGRGLLHDFLASPPPLGTPAWDPFGGCREGAGRGEVALIDRQGRTIEAWIGQSLVRSGAELRTLSVVRELTRERARNSALGLSRERFQRFFANAPVGIAVVDRRGRFVEANRAVGELFGAAPQALIGCELVGLLNEGDRAAIAVKLAAAADGQMDREPVEIRLERPTERPGERPGERTMVLLLSRLDDEEGGASGSAIAGRDAVAGDAVAGDADAQRYAPGGDPLGGLTVYFIDVTEQKHLETQFAQSQKMQAVGQLAGGVAHDFNNLLTAMIGFCDLLLLRCRPGDPAFADIMQIKQNANRAANLVRQLLAFSRQQTLQPRVLDVTDVLVELSHLLRRLIGENIELEVVHGRGLGLVKVDQGQLEQVVINLAVNARDAMPGGGRLTIRTANINRAQALRRGAEVMPEGEYVLIEVADTGAGISADNLGRIFEPFFSTKEVGSGTGLGLSTVYGIVKQTGGFVFVDSPPGRGARFEIYLPRHRPADGAPAPRPDSAEPAAPKDLTGNGTVMLVEDDDPVRIFGARALRNKGYRVTEANSGEAALDRIKNGPDRIDLLITDVVMPHMDGPALIREVREIDPAIKVIFISGYTEDSFRQRLDSDSDIHFLAKPFSLKQLAIKVKEVIGGSAG